MAGVPEEVLFPAKPQLADGLLDHAHAREIRVAFLVGDEVYGGRELRQGIRQCQMGEACWRSAPTTPSPPARAAP